MYIDRLVEYLNKIQQGTKKSAHASSFGRAMDLTRLLPALLHVRHAFQNHETGIPEASDPITDAMLVSARLLQNKILEAVGRDLTIPTTHNVCWHTGIPVPLHTNAYRSRCPHELLWRVMFGRVAGVGRARLEHWCDFARRMITRHFFPY